MTNLPPGASPADPHISGTSPWERWTETVRIGDRCTCAGREATVTAITDDHLWARLDGREDAEPWAWEDCDDIEHFTVDQIRTILRNNPTAAFEAVKGAKVAGPRITRDSGGSERPAIGGSLIGFISRSGGRWCCTAPNMWSRHDEDQATFAARIDAALMADGWVFVP